MKKFLALVLVALLVMAPITAFADSTTETVGVQADDEFYAKADLKALEPIETMKCLCDLSSHAVSTVCGLTCHAITRASAYSFEKMDEIITEGKKLGITIQSLQNAYWAGVMTALQELLDSVGAEATIVACDDSSATQIGQIENFISAKCDLIMVHPSDAAAVEDVCAQAREAGIKVMCWDDPMENTDANWILDNTYLGHAIGELAADFINEHYSEDHPAEVIVIGYPQTVILLERENGIKAALEENAAGKYKIVASQAGIIASDAQTAVETTLQAHPDAKVVAGIGAGGGQGPCLQEL